MANQIVKLNADRMVGRPIVLDGKNTYMLGVVSLDVNGDPVTGGGGGGDASAANQTAVQALAGVSAAKANAVQGIAGGLAVAVSGTFFQATQPVSGTVAVSGSVAVTGPLTDAQLRAAVVPVSLTSTTVTGTVAISAASLPLPTGAATETTLAALNTKVTAVNTGEVTISAALPTGANVIGALAANQSVNKAQINGVAPLMGNGVTGTGSQRVTIASDNTPFTVKDAAGNSRVDRNFILDTFTAAPVADALQSVIQWYNNAAVGATTQPAVVPAGKILRLIGGRIETKSLATVGSAVMRIRSNAAGLVVIGSPIVASVSAGSSSGATTVAMTGGLDHAEFTFGERGHEIPAGSGVGFSLAGYGPTGTLTLQGVTRFEVWGYEYTA